jgi:hypothetical protein
MDAPFPPDAPASSYLARRQSLARLRVVLLTQWGIYAALLFALSYFFREGTLSESGLDFCVGFMVLSAPGHVALVFWRYIMPSQYVRRAHLFISGRLDLQVQGLGFLNFFALLLGYVAISFYFEGTSDLPVVLSMCFSFPTMLLFGGIIWGVFFKKDAAYVTYEPPVAAANVDFEQTFSKV